MNVESWSAYRYYEETGRAIRGHSPISRTRLILDYARYVCEQVTTGLICAVLGHVGFDWSYDGGGDPHNYTSDYYAPTMRARQCSRCLTFEEEAL